MSDGSTVKGLMCRTVGWLKLQEMSRSATRWLRTVVPVICAAETVSVVYIALQSIIHHAAIAVFICSLDRRAGQGGRTTSHSRPRRGCGGRPGSGPVMRDGNDARERGYLMGHVDHVIMSRLRFAIASRTNLRIRPLRSISSRHRSRSYRRCRPYQTPCHALRS